MDIEMNLWVGDTLIVSTKWFVPARFAYLLVSMNTEDSPFDVFDLREIKRLGENYKISSIHKNVQHSYGAGSDHRATLNIVLEKTP